MDPNLAAVMEIDTVTGQSDLITVLQGTADFTELVFAGDLEVVLLGNGELEHGQTFKLFDADIFSGAFDNILLPDLGSLGYEPGEGWDLSRLSVDGTISIFAAVPEPVTLVLWTVLGLTVAGAARLRRKHTA